MIEKTEESTVMGAETGVPEAKMAIADAFVKSGKSLMESDTEDDDVSRNPSFVEESDEENAAGERDFRIGSDSAHLEYENVGVYEPNCTQTALPMCQADLVLLPGCQGQGIADQIEFMTQCRHPLDLFSMFHEHSNREGVDILPDMLPGMYSIPKSCEYCGAPDSDHCSSGCQRPRSFFRKKRPPFCPPSADWDPKTDFEVPRETSSKHIERGNELPAAGRRPSFLAGLFGQSDQKV